MYGGSFLHRFRTIPYYGVCKSVLVCWICGNLLPVVQSSIPAALFEKRGRTRLGMQPTSNLT